jgi:hypothetical protein
MESNIPHNLIYIFVIFAKTRCTRGWYVSTTRVPTQINSVPETIHTDHVKTKLVDNDLNQSITIDFIDIVCSDGSTLLHVS